MAWELVRRFIRKFFLLVSFCLLLQINAFGEIDICTWIGEGNVHFKSLSGTIRKDLSGIISDKIIADVTMKDSKNERGTIGIDSLYNIKGNLYICVDYRHNIGIDFLFDFNTEEDFKIGTRLAYLDGELKYNFFTIEEKTNRVSGVLNLEGSCKASSIFLMCGGSYSKKISKEISLNGKLFVGTASVNFKSNQSISCESYNDKIVDNEELNKAQFCLASDLSLGIEWVIVRNLKFGFGVGYRFMPKIMPEIKMLEKENIKLDFSGFIYNTCISLILNF
jgi:hypothetical protein